MPSASSRIPGLLPWVDHSPCERGDGLKSSGAGDRTRDLRDSVRLHASYVRVDIAVRNDAYDKDVGVLWTTDGQKTRTCRARDTSPRMADGYDGYERWGLDEQGALRRGYGSVEGCRVRRLCEDGRSILRDDSTTTTPMAR